MATVPSPVAEPQAAISPFGRIIGVFFTPKPTFEDIVRKPNWLLPSVLILLMSLAAVIALNSHFSWRDYMYFRERSRTFQSLGASFERGYAMTGSREPENLNGGILSRTLFSTLEVTAFRGRLFLADDETGPPVAVISHALWTKRFHQSLAVLDETLTLNDKTFRVVGILPPGFSYRVLNAPHDVDVWTLIQAGDPEYKQDSVAAMAIVGRLKPGVTLNQARSEIEILQRYVKKRRETIEERVLVTLDVRQTRKGARQARIERAGERGEVAEAYARPGAREIEVAAIAPPGEAALDEERAHLDAIAPEERPDDATAARADTAEPAPAGTMQDAQQHRFGLVVEGVCGGDLGRAEPCRGPLEKRVAHPARFRLEIACRHVHGLDVQRHGELSREALHEGAIGRALGAAQTMIEVGRNDVDRERGLQLTQSREQGDRVRAARHGDEDDVAGRDQVESPGGGAELVEEAAAHAA